MIAHMHYAIACFMLPTSIDALPSKNQTLCKHSTHILLNTVNTLISICDLPRENRPSLHLVIIVEIPILKFLIGITSFCLC